MKIIVDGPNNVGKSSIIETITEYLDLDVVHCSKHSEISRDYFIDLLNRDNIILDRGPISELVYSEIYERDFKFNQKDVKDILQNLSKDVIYVILLSDKRTLHRNYELKGEKDFSENNNKFISQELKLFSKYGEMFNCFVVEDYDFSFKDIVVNNIFKELSK